MLDGYFYYICVYIFVGTVHTASNHIVISTDYYSVFFRSA